MNKEIWYDWNGANIWLFRQINSIHGGTYDALMVFLSRLANHHMFPYYLAGFAAFSLGVYFLRKITKRGGSPYILASWFAVFMVLCAGYVVEGVIIKEAKDFFAYPRPFILLAGDVQLLDSQLSADDGYRSFPSGHAAFITLMVVGLWPVLSKNFKWLGAALIFGVCWSRMALGAHFPADVLGGFILSFIIVLTLSGLIYSILRNAFGMKC